MIFSYFYDIIFIFIKRGAADIDQQKTPYNGTELYRRFLDGDRDALTALVELYSGELEAYINKMVDNVYDAEELMIDSFVRLVRSKAEFTAEAALKSYLFKTGKNLALRHLKKRGCRNITIETINSLLESTNEISPENEILIKERKQQLEAAMTKLKPEHNEVLRLIYFEKSSYVQAGESMKKTVRQIDGLAYRAKASLKRKLESDGFTYESE